ncbi:MAG TPA: hypothetical protein VK629_08260, partial [Steroidobacteraceae bacterium]|nr:hypothetical protein [Steroidobacteraceae bacterium]
MQSSPSQFGFRTARCYALAASIAWTAQCLVAVDAQALEQPAAVPPLSAQPAGAQPAAGATDRQVAWTIHVLDVNSKEAKEIARSSDESKTNAQA